MYQPQMPISPSIWILELEGFKKNLLMKGSVGTGLTSDSFSVDNALNRQKICLQVKAKMGDRQCTMMYPENWTGD
jgi:hypothetical protein